jgi:hypothetical protein
MPVLADAMQQIIRENNEMIKRMWKYIANSHTRFRDVVCSSLLAFLYCCITFSAAFIWVDTGIVLINLHYIWKNVFLGVAASFVVGILLFVERYMKYKKHKMLQYGADSQSMRE